MPVLSVLCPQLNLLNPPPKKIPGYATGVRSGRGLCDELITRPEESYRLWCVVVCDLENAL